MYLGKARVQKKNGADPTHCGNRDVKLFAGSWLCSIVWGFAKHCQVDHCVCVNPAFACVTRVQWTRINACVTTAANWWWWQQRLHELYEIDVNEQHGGTRRVWNTGTKCSLTAASGITWRTQRVTWQWQSSDTMCATKEHVFMSLVTVRGAVKVALGGTRRRQRTWKSTLVAKLLFEQVQPPPVVLLPRYWLRSSYEDKHIIVVSPSPLCMHKFLLW